MFSVVRLEEWQSNLPHRKLGVRQRQENRTYLAMVLLSWRKFLWRFLPSLTWPFSAGSFPPPDVESLLGMLRKEPHFGVGDFKDTYFKPRMDSIHWNDFLKQVRYTQGSDVATKPYQFSRHEIRSLPLQEGRCDFEKKRDNDIALVYNKGVCRELKAHVGDLKLK